MFDWIKNKRQEKARKRAMREFLWEYQGAMIALRRAWDRVSPFVPNFIPSRYAHDFYETKCIEDDIQFATDNPEGFPSAVGEYARAAETADILLKGGENLFGKTVGRKLRRQREQLKETSKNLGSIVKEREVSDE